MINPDIQAREKKKGKIDKKKMAHLGIITVVTVIKLNVNGINSIQKAKIPD